MTTINVGSITDYNRISPDNYAELLDQAPSAPLLSDTNLWLVDPTELAGKAADQFLPESSITNLSETLDQNLTVPFNNIAFSEPEITFSETSGVGEETFTSESTDSESSLTQNETGQISGSGSTSTSGETSTNSLTDTSIITSFSSTSTGSSDGGSLNLGSPVAASGTTSGDSTTTTGDDSTSTGDSGTPTSDSGSTTTGDSSTPTGDSGSTTTGDSSTPTGDSGSTTIGDGGNNNDGSTTTTTQQPTNTPEGQPADVPFSLTESLGLSLLLCMVGAHKLLKRRAKSPKTA